MRRVPLVLATAALVVLPVAPAVAVTVPVAAPAVREGSPGDLEAFGYGTTSLRGGFGSAELFLPLPGGRRPSGTTRVVLDVTASPLLRGTSTLTVLAGGVPVTSAPLGGEVPDRTRVVVDVPAELVGTDGLVLALRSRLRLTDDECEDPHDPALWVTVSGDSTVQLATADAPRGLQAAGTALTRGPGQSAVDVALPEGAGPEVLAAAGAAASQVGRWQGARGQDALVGLVLAEPGRPVTGPAVVVAPAPSTPPGLPVTGDGSVLLGPDGPVPGDRGVLALSQRGAPVLLVGGATPTAVLAAGQALADPSRQAALSGAVTALTGVEPARLPDRATPWTDGAASFAQLGLDARTVTGPGVQEVVLTAERPPDWTLEDDGRLRLDIASSAALDPTTSTVQVLLNGADLGSQRLRPGGTQTYLFGVDEGLADRRLDGRPLRALDLTVRLSLQVEQERCDSTDLAAAASATVLPTSALTLPHRSTDDAELGRFPSPVDDDGGRVTVVLPASPDSTELAAGLQVAAALGRASAADAPAPLLVTSDRLEGEARERGLVVLGSAVSELSLDADLGRSSAEGPAAILGLVRSPFDDDRTALLVTGAPREVLAASRLLGSRTALGTLRGSRVAVAGSAPAISLVAGDAGPPAVLAPVLGGDDDLLERSYAVPALVLLGSMLVVLGLLARYRWGRRRRA